MYIFKDFEGLIESIKEDYDKADKKALATRGKPRSHDHVFASGERYGLKTALDFLNDYLRAHPELERKAD